MEGNLQWQLDRETVEAVQIRDGEKKVSSRNEVQDTNKRVKKK
jgi:hypothetical protein